MKLFLAIAWLAWVNVGYGQKLKNVLPQPQKLTNQSGFSVFKPGTTIGFDGTPSRQDWLTARAIADYIKQTTGLTVRLVAKGPAAITLFCNGKLAELPGVDEKTGPQSREAYQLTVADNRIQLKANSSAGLYYAAQTLRQLIQKHGATLAVQNTQITDWPEMAYRGFMMDMSHMQFPKMEEIKHQLDFMARWKLNQYYFYSEANIELDGYPLLFPNVRFSKAQVREIIDYARERHIDVIPNINLYGHLHDLFKLEHYRDLSITPYGREFNADDQRTQVIVRDWVDQFVALFPSPFFHIGFDETYLIGVEAKKLKVAPEKLYTERLNKTIELVEKKGKKVFFYGDMLEQYSQAIPDVTGKPIVAVWHYIPYEKAKYDTLFKPFQAAGIPLFVQSASRNWRWLYPGMKLGFANNRLLIEKGKQYGAIGYLNSGWTDEWMVLMRHALPDIAHGAVVSWQKQPISDADFIRAYAETMYGDSIAVYAEKALTSLNEAAYLTEKIFVFSGEAMWENPFTKKSQQLYKEHKEGIRKARLQAEEAQLNIYKMLELDPENKTFFAMLTAAKELDLLCMKYLFAGRIGDIRNEYRDSRDPKEFKLVLSEATYYFSSTTIDLYDGFIDVKAMLAKAWLNEYTDYRLGVPMARFDQEINFWLRAQKQLRLLLDVAPDQPLPELESLMNS